VDITTVPQTLDHVRGVINLRGKVKEKIVILLDIDEVLSTDELKMDSEVADN
jgi:chemotaxis signal transduction protein